MALLENEKAEAFVPRLFGPIDAVLCVHRILPMGQIDAADGTAWWMR